MECPLFIIRHSTLSNHKYKKGDFSLKGPESPFLWQMHILDIYSLLRGRPSDESCMVDFRC